GLTLYSFLLELAWLLSYLGRRQLWLSGLYTEWLFWIISMRVLLLIAAVVVLAIKASNEISASGGGSSSELEDFLSHVSAQLRQLAETAFSGAKLFGRL